MINQEKLNRLVDIIKSIRSEGKRNYALSLLNELISVINTQSEEFNELLEKKLGQKKISHEIEKYIWLLIIYGYNQNSIALLGNDTIEFLVKNKSQLIRVPVFNDVFKIQNMYRSFKFENEREPNDLNELKKYINGQIND